MIRPTNTMRACTAVVTELSYNYENAAYRAEIEFISAADWEKELHILFQDLFDASGSISRDCTSDPDSDAGIAYAKIKAVYPKKTKEDICNSSIEKMLQDVSHILGKTRDIKENDSLIFYKHLQRYVDSKEKATGKKDKDKKKEPKGIEYWVRAPFLNVLDWPIDVLKKASDQSCPHLCQVSCLIHRCCHRGPPGCS